jgi:hypothetical protein
MQEESHEITDGVKAMRLSVHVAEYEALSTRLTYWRVAHPFPQQVGVLCERPRI